VYERTLGRFRRRRGGGPTRRRWRLPLRR
jgi:hypothetical protein